MLNSNTYADVNLVNSSGFIVRSLNIPLVDLIIKCEEDFKIYKDEITSIIKKLKDLTRFDSIEEMKESLLSTKPYIIAISNIINKFDDIIKTLQLLFQRKDGTTMTFHKETSSQMPQYLMAAEQNASCIKSQTLQRQQLHYVMVSL